MGSCPDGYRVTNEGCKNLDMSKDDPHQLDGTISSVSSGTYKNGGPLNGGARRQYAGGGRAGIRTTRGPVPRSRTAGRTSGTHRGVRRAGGRAANGYAGRANGGRVNRHMGRNFAAGGTSVRRQSSVRQSGRRRSGRTLMDGAWRGRYGS